MKKKLVVGIIILLIGAYLGYKCFNLYYYSIASLNSEQFDEIIKGISTNDDITITSEKNTKYDYLVFDEVNIKNDFEEFKVLEQSNDSNIDNFVKYILYDENNKSKASFWISKTYSYVDMLKKDKTLFGTITNEDLTEYLEKNNITNDIQLFEFLAEEKNTKSNIFTSVKRMKENYTLQFIMATILPTMDSLTIINGDYNGYIFNLNNDFKEVSILKNNKRYVFTFYKLDYFTDEYISELLNTIIISDENPSKDQIIKVNNELYYNTNEESTVEGRCGNMDGYITSSVSDDSIPSINNQSNFGTGYGYQYIENNVEVRIDGKFIVFKKR